MRRIITSFVLAIVIPALVLVYLSKNPSVFVLTSRNIVISIVVFISILGIIIFYKMINTIISLSSSLKVIAKGDINHRVNIHPENDIEELTDSINQLSGRMRKNADELEKRAILIERFNQEVKKMNNLRFMLPEMVHELRAPLINIEKSSGLLLKKENAAVDGQDKEMIEIINNNAQRLSRLVDNLLDISKMEAGKLSMDFKKFSVSEVVTEAVQSVDNWRQSKNLSLKVETAQGLPLVSASRDRIIQVLVNLISNAVKFTPAGGTIKVFAHLYTSFEKAGISEDGVKFIEFSVEDNGSGIPENRLSAIFERYKAASGDSFDTLHSTGLGLPIAKEIVEMHGGRIWVESHPGKGSKFMFIIPESMPASGEGTGKETKAC